MNPSTFPTKHPTSIGMFDFPRKYLFRDTSSCDRTDQVARRDKLHSKQHQWELRMYRIYYPILIAHMSRLTKEEDLEGTTRDVEATIDDE